MRRVGCLNTSPSSHDMQRVLHSLSRLAEGSLSHHNARPRAQQQQIPREYFVDKKHQLMQNWYLSEFLRVVNLNIKMYRTIILPVVLYGCET